MGDKTAIGWTDATWNPVVGCSKVSPGCANCYAETLTARYAGRPGWIGEHRPWTPGNAEHNVRLRPDRLDQPLRWKRPRMIFVNSMSDLFHENIPVEFLAEVFAVMAVASHHTYQVLTKRAERMRDILRDVGFWMMVADAIAERTGRAVALGGEQVVFPHVWFGVSIENRQFVWRADVLRDTPAAVRTISAEPLLANIADELFPRLLGYTPVNVREEQGERVDRLSGGRAWRAGDPAGRDDLEGGSPSRNQGQAGHLPPSPLHAEARGECDTEGLSPGSRDAQGREDLCDGAPARVAAPARADTPGPDREPREREARRQLALELDADDGRGADAARGQRAGHRSRVPSGRGGKHSGEAHRTAGGGDSRETRSGRGAPVDRNRFRDRLPDGVEDRAGTAPISWVICGGESGPGHRPMREEWVRDLRDACQAARTAFFFKQDSGPRAGQRGRFADEREWPREMPNNLQPIQQ